MRSIAPRIGILVGLIAAVSACLRLNAETSWLLTNGHVEMRVERHGGIISELRPAIDSSSWLSRSSDRDASEPFAHFLCFDRWGPVTEKEQAAGFAFHGEAARNPWSLTAPATEDRVELDVTLPRAGLAAQREVSLAATGGGFQIQTEVHNPTSEPRPFNVVEHITLAESWADPAVRLITNARQGLWHERGEWVKDAHIDWPWLEREGIRRDLREADARRGRFIASLRFPADAEWGWVCLQHPTSGALLAYVWRTEEMSWLNLYWFANGERVVQRAIEPGTTGLHRPMPELVATAVALDRPVVHWLATAQQRRFTILGGVAVRQEGFGVLQDLRATGAGWVAMDDAGGEQLLLPHPAGEFAVP